MREKKRPVWLELHGWRAMTRGWRNTMGSARLRLLDQVKGFGFDSKSSWAFTRKRECSRQGNSIGQRPRGEEHLGRFVVHNSSG